VKDIAARGISTRRQSQLFYKLVNYLKCSNCIELGTSLGLNTLYLALANKAGQVTSIEGSPALSHFAKALAQKQRARNIRFINADFDPAVAEQLHELPALDLLYMDGNHTLEATLRYFEQAMPKMQEQSVMILDDIYWSPEMTQAWEKIKSHPRVTLSVDTFYFGLVFFRTEVKEKTHLKLYL
jgi:predicted O-methyltransferase YrrM